MSGLERGGWGWAGVSFKPHSESLTQERSRLEAKLSNYAQPTTFGGTQDGPVRRKAVAAKPNCPYDIPRTHTVKGKNLKALWAARAWQSWSWKILSPPPIPSVLLNC